MAGKDRILILGPTGAIGRHIVWASVKAGNPTFVLVRNTPGSNNRVNLVKAANPETKEELIESFKNSGVNLIQVGASNFLFRTSFKLNPSRSN